MISSKYSGYDSHPSIAASMDDFEDREFSPSVPDLPSQHSGFRSNVASDLSESSSRRSYSPPAWRKAGSGWFRHRNSLSPHRNALSTDEPDLRHHSVEHDHGDASAYRSASRVPLPSSPAKGRSPSNSAEPRTGVGASEGDQGGGDTTLVADPTGRQPSNPQPSKRGNYIRFTGSVAVQQKTEAIEAAVFYTQKVGHHMTKSRYNTLLYALGSLFFYWLCANLFRTPDTGPMPDLIRVASLAQSFEPIIYYSEAGHEQISQLQETGVAVWDLSESVRNTNMTSSPIIVNQLESLSDNLRDLAVEMTKWFAGLDADVDAILWVMEWAGRELGQIESTPPGTIGSMWSNAQSLLARTGIVGSDSDLMRNLVGPTSQQRQRGTLERIFNEFLNVLEESINNELNVSIRLVGLFEAIDGQFNNLHRTVIREQDQQERSESDTLSSLWTRVIGVNASRLRKYEKNRNLLQSVRDRTVHNMHILVQHKQRLLSMKAKLDQLRQRLFSPLVRRSDSSTASIEEQMRGLEGTYGQLKGVRERQKSKTMELLYGARDRRDALHGGNHLRRQDGIEGGGQQGHASGRPGPERFAKRAPVAVQPYQPEFQRPRAKAQAPKDCDDHRFPISTGTTLTSSSQYSIHPYQTEQETTNLSSVKLPEPATLSPSSPVASTSTAPSIMSTSYNRTVKSEFIKQGRTNSQRPRSMSRQESGVRGNGTPQGGQGEQTPLLGHDNNGASGAGANSVSQTLHNLGINHQGKPLYDDDRRWVRWPSNFMHLTWLTLTSNYVNVLLVFVPVGIVLGALGMDPTWVFIVNFLAIMPLAALLSFATEELSAKMGQTIGGLMNATFGNAVELIVAVVALAKGQIRIVQASMLGSILSNILLVLGCCFLASGVRREESRFNETVASTMSSLMAVAATSLIIPATLYSSVHNSLTKGEADTNVLALSRGTAIIMLILYIIYLVFQLKTHARMFDAETQAEDDSEADGDAAEDEQILSPVAATVALLLVTLLVAVCAEYLVDSIDHIVESSGINKTFIGLILLPIVGNAAEHVTAVVVAWKDKMDLAIGVAIGSSIQIVLFLTPFMVIVGWIIGEEMTLNFQIFETVVFFLSVLVVNYLIQDGKSNYLEGCLCLGTYLIIAIAFYVYPEDTATRTAALSARLA